VGRGGDTGPPDDAAHPVLGRASIAYALVLSATRAPYGALSSFYSTLTSTRNNVPAAATAANTVLAISALESAHFDGLPAIRTARRFVLGVLDRKWLHRIAFFGEQELSACPGRLVGLLPRPSRAFAHPRVVRVAHAATFGA
jgi:hypothetical protein